MKNTNNYLYYLYYIGMTDALLQSEEPRTTSEGISLAEYEGNVKVNDNISISYRLGDYDHPDADPMGTDHKVHMLHLTLLENGEKVKEITYYKEMNGKDYLRSPASLKEKYKYILKRKLIEFPVKSIENFLPVPYKIVNRNTKNHKDVTPEVELELAKFTRNLALQHEHILKEEQQKPSQR